MNNISKARELMATRGLAKHIQEGPSGNVCVAGALAIAATGHTGHSCPGLEVVSAVAQELFPERCINPFYSSGHQAVGFNNHDDTTLAEVLHVMDIAAARLDLETESVPADRIPSLVR